MLHDEHVTDSDDDSSDDDWQDVPVSSRTAIAAPTLPVMVPSVEVVEILTLDVVELLAMKLANLSKKQHAATSLSAFAATCHILRAHVLAASQAWDVLSKREFAVFHQRKIDVRVGFPFVPPSPANRGIWRAGDLSDTEMLAQLCSGHVDANAALDLVATSVAWCVGLLRQPSTLAGYSRPTIGTLAEHPKLYGGSSNFARLTRVRQTLLSKLRVVSADITALPFADMIVIPSNEYMEDPGFGVIHAVYALGGDELAQWVRARRQKASVAAGLEAQENFEALEAAGTVTGPAYGRINARWLCHACGISFYDPVAFQRVMQSTPIAGMIEMQSEASHAAEALRVAARKQLLLLRRIFQDAARVNATSVAIPAVSAGKRGFPALLAAAITCGVAANEIMASGGQLEVTVAIYGDEQHRDVFDCARLEVAQKLVPVRVE